MASKLQIVQAGLQEEKLKIAESEANWLAFLRTAANNYKYSFNDQILIHAQKPDATACAEIGFWNEKMHRWVNRGTKGIALIDTDGNRPRLRYVFDVSDTNARYGNEVRFWTADEPYHDDIITALEDSFGELADKSDLGAAITSVAGNLAEDNKQDYITDLMAIAGKGHLAEMDEAEVDRIFGTALQRSVGYMILSRCGIDARDFLDAEASDPILPFNTTDTIDVLGTATSDIAEMGLREIESTVRNLQRSERNPNRTFVEKQGNRYDEGASRNPPENSLRNERSNSNETDVHTAERLFDSESDLAGEHVSDARQVRDDAQDVPQESPESAVYHAADERHPVGSSERDGPDGEPDDGIPDAADGEGAGRDGSAQGERSDALGTGDGEHPKRGGGNRADGDRLRITLPPEEEQRDHIAEAEAEEASAFVISQADIDAVLARGSGISEGKCRIYEQYLKQEGKDKNIAFLRNEYGIGGAYPVVAGRNLDEAHDGKGIKISRGSISNPDVTMLLSWAKVEKRIGELIAADRYLNPAEREHYPVYRAAAQARAQRWEIANEFRSIVYDYNDFVTQTGDEKKKLNQYYLSSCWNAFGIGEKKMHARTAQGDFILPMMREAMQTIIADHTHLTERCEAMLTSLNSEVAKPLEPTYNELHPPEIRKEYRFSLGDRIYIGTQEFELLSLGETEVELFDPQFPLFHQTLPKTEFDEKVKENPLNDRYLQVVETEPPGPAAELPSYPSDVDKIFVDTASQTVTWIYFNPDSASGAQFIENILTFEQFRDFYDAYGSDREQFLESINEAADQWLADINTPFFATAQAEYESEPSCVNFTEETIEKIIADVDRYLADKQAEQAIDEDGAEYDADGRMILEDEFTATQTETAYKEDQVQGLPAPMPVPAHRETPHVLYPEITSNYRTNFRIENDDIGVGTPLERFHHNIMAIQLLKKLETEHRLADTNEQRILADYVGWGGLSEFFKEENPHNNELRAVLTDEEYTAARESTLTAFYTPPVVIRAMYQALANMGFQTGNILEPSCGIGNFLGMLPEQMRDSQLYGVELDSISGRIAQQLYQKSSVAVQGFETTNLPDSFFDAAVGNVPFGQFKVSDKRYDKFNFLIHDYFFARTLDKVRPGGIVTFITSSGTMDKENPKVRKYIAQRADLLGAIRLPNNTFKAAAGTEVTADILFLQKRDRLIDIEPDWVHLGKDENGIAMNQYFIDNPDMILGEMQMISGAHGPTPACVPFEDQTLSDLLTAAIQNIHGQVVDYELAEADDVGEDRSIPADPNVRNYSYTVIDGQIYYRENSRMNPVEVSDTAQNRIKGLIGIRESVRRLIELQTEDYPDTEIQAEQERLNTRYDEFSKKYGLINSRGNNTAFSNDSSYCLLSSLEVLDDDGKFVGKADMFSKRTIRKKVIVQAVDTAAEALALSLAEKTKVDMAYMSDLTGKTEEDLFSDLQGVIFRNPLYTDEHGIEAEYVPADAYLSGNVREKLATARLAAETDPAYKINVQALEAVQPKDLTASEISVRLGATWLPPEIVSQFMFELFQTPRWMTWNIKVHFSSYTGEWQVEGKSYDKVNVRANTTYGTSRINGYRIIEETLNLRDVRIFDYPEDADGKKHPVLNKNETAIAQGKQEMIKDAFQNWIWSDPQRREALCRMYNERFNSVRPRSYDGSHLNFVGMNPIITLKKHQVDAVAHILYGGNTLLAHEVGAGKTFEMVAAAQESKRLGLCQKSLFVVPNHLISQWATEYLQLYPSANILVATKKDFETKNRKRFCARIATGDYDAVIIGHSQFEKIPMSIERQRMILQQQLDDIMSGIIEMKANRGDKFSIKQLEAAKKSVAVKLDKLNDQTRKDDLVTFEELGVDRLFIDEAHYYKNRAKRCA